MGVYKVYNNTPRNLLKINDLATAEIMFVIDVWRAIATTLITKVVSLFLRASDRLVLLCTLDPVAVCTEELVNGLARVPNDVAIERIASQAWRTITFAPCNDMVNLKRPLVLELAALTPSSEYGECRLLQAPEMMALVSAEIAAGWHHIQWYHGRLVVVGRLCLLGALMALGYTFSRAPSQAA